MVFIEDIPESNLSGRDFVAARLLYVFFLRLTKVSGNYQEGRGPKFEVIFGKNVFRWKDQIKDIKNLYLLKKSWTGLIIGGGEEGQKTGFSEYTSL